MTASLTMEGDVATVTVTGRLDTMTAGELQKTLDGCPSEAKSMVFDFAALEYISSAGLRVLLGAHRKMSAVGGDMKVMNANTTVKDVFEMTGFSGIFSVQ